MVTAVAKDHRPGRPLLRCLLSLVHGTLLLMAVLCAVGHGTTEGTHGAVPARAAVPVVVADFAGHYGPHRPHGAAQCAPPAAVVLATARAAGYPPAAAPSVLAAVSASVSMSGRRLLGRPDESLRRRARTGRLALVRTSRWRI
ncbi:hypothetical protein [Streptomyces sp. ISL-86]|uniref:hypothetical protein n=1 Tax=Streptomyces sp. ISL-86 TaxID=2819187 RepID=UPI001BE756DE|nr:hypothetical protein [Streptomyces sp. ISL-86]MBT2457558.1 hypothetical protein [Streptomyces sp. ISL-86]